MNILTGIILLLFVIFLGIIFYKLFYSQDKNIELKSPLDGNKYIIQSPENNNTIQKYENVDVDINSKIAVDYLANIKILVDKLVNYMKENNLPNKEVAMRLYNRWKNCILREVSSSENAVAYTLNKGDEIRLCIRLNNEFENINTSIFVILHELAHLMSISFDHTEEFRENFNFIVHLASNLGVYVPQNFAEEPVNYCGVQINTTPCSNGTCVFNKSELIE